MAVEFDVFESLSEGQHEIKLGGHYKVVTTEDLNRMSFLLGGYLQDFYYSSNNGETKDGE